MDGSVEAIKPYVAQFIEFAKQHPELTFYVTRIGCGIAGFKVEQIAPLFKEAIYIENIILPKDFVEVILNISNLSINSAMNKTHSGIIGAIAGDCFGAVYEFQPVKSADFDLYKAPRFTDDTVMTLAVAKWLTID